MWISRQQWEALVKRIDQLERRESERPHVDNFTVYPGHPIPPDPVTVRDDLHMMYYSVTRYHGPSQTIAVKDVLEHVLKHLGIKLRYDSGQPARINIETPSQRDAAVERSSEDEK